MSYETLITIPKTSEIMYRGYVNATPKTVAESVERGPCMRKIGSSVPGRVKPMTYKIDACHFLAWYLALLA